MEIIPRLMSALNAEELSAVAAALPAEVLSADLARRAIETSVSLGDEELLLSQVPDAALQIELEKRGYATAVLGMTANNQTAVVYEAMTANDHVRNLRATQAEVLAAGSLKRIATERRTAAVIAASKAGGLSRRQVGDVLGLTSGRVQQIIDQG